MGKNGRRTRAKRNKQNRCQVNEIDVLPDDVLLGVFDFCVETRPWCETGLGIETWQLLVHVCRRWRSLVFQSPRRLNLRLVCTPKTSISDTLDIWPPLPLVAHFMDVSLGMDNIIATLGQSNRVCAVVLSDLVDWQVEKVLAVMQVPFPELTDLHIICRGTVPDIPVPDSFLGGSAPTLRHFSLSGLPFPGWSNLLLSTNRLVNLELSHIPHSGYIPPEAIIALISVLSSLEELIIDFDSPQSRPGLESRSLPPPKRSILPALNELHFRGATEYLEELMSRIDTPRLNVLRIAFFNQIDFDCPRLAQFINYTPTLEALDEARVRFDDSTASVKLRRRTSQSQYGANDLKISIISKEPDMQLTSIVQVCNTSLPPVSTVEDLYIEEQHFREDWSNDGIANILWLHLLLPFTAVRNLYISKEIAPGIAAALEEVVGGRITEVLPGLQNIFVEELEPTRHFQEKIGQFVAARQLSDHPIAISDWDRLGILMRAKILELMARR